MHDVIIVSTRVAEASVVDTTTYAVDAGVSIYAVHCCDVPYFFLFLPASAKVPIDFHCVAQGFVSSAASLKFVTPGNESRGYGGTYAVPTTCCWTLGS